ncbi:DUF551 domain-containing protein [Azospirillum sp. B21]|uniref:DUF551 domain-containing protein n=1 Tax=Azospirillum sp. B21 TaxID=2607496 RepID=UPI0011ECA67F|nr:DUF551 domain-containing protein [Azospirillum sp. B21]KAA0574683.1 DUF551 domain-containing protein [Azospirillum sp. B21]
MLIARHLPALAAAERALGRLDAALADPIRLAWHTPCAIRRNALASLRLDGTLLTEEDLVLMGGAPDAVAPGVRIAASRGVALVSFANALDIGRFTVQPAVDGSAAGRLAGGVSSITAAGLQAALEGLAMLEGDPVAIVCKETEPAEPSAPRELAPWSASWGVAAFQAWLTVEGLPDTLHSDAAESVVDGIASVERAVVGAPGLVGAIRALLHLHHRDDPPIRRRAKHDPFEHPTVRQLRGQSQASAPTARFWPSLARLAGPALLRAACGIDRTHLPIAVAMAKSPALFRSMLVAGEDEAVGWLLDRFADQADLEVEALTSSAKCDASRRAALIGRRRDAGARTLLDHLWANPVLTVRSAGALLCISERAARGALAALVDAGILRGVPAWRDDDAPPGRTAARSLAYVVNEPIAVSGPLGTTRSRRRSEPPAGSPMYWQPIATAPQDGKPRLVWDERPFMAAFTWSTSDNTSAWRVGRRVLQPTHWLPLAPPKRMK